MPDRARVALGFGGVGALIVLVFEVVLVLTDGLDRETALLVGLAASAPVLAALALVWRMLDARFFAPLTDLADNIAKLAEQKRPDRNLPPVQRQALAPLDESLRHLIANLLEERREADAAHAKTKARLAESHTVLGTALKDVSEGVLVVSADHRIIFANPSASRLLGEEIAPGRPLFALITREPVLHGLAQVSTAGAISMVCATTDASRLLQGRLSPIAGQDGYLISLSDNDRDAAALERDNALRKAITHDLRRPIANLRAAAETLVAFPDMTPRERAAFDEVVAEESQILSDRIEGLDSDFQARSITLGTMADIYSLDLFNCLARKCARDLIGLSMEGFPLWLKGDSQSLPTLLHRLIMCLHNETGCSSFDVEAMLADRHIYLDISWQGAAIGGSKVNAWLDQAIDSGPDRRTLRDILDLHGSEPWSMAVKGSMRAVLRLPFPPPQRPQFLAGEAVTASRPEFHDFALIGAHCDAGDRANLRLSEMTFVVFDCETTGLKPDDGDAIVQIGAVRVQAKTVMTARTFERLVDPGRPIPPASTAIHGISDAMVKGKPPLAVVLPQFLDFADGSVLAAHNAAFDLKFLSRGGSIAAPVLDTMLLSELVDPGADPSLEALARRLGIALPPRRTALADALTTADVLVRLLGLLEARGLNTLGQVLEATRQICALNTRQEVG